VTFVPGGELKRSPDGTYSLQWKEKPGEGVRFVAPPTWSVESNSPNDAVIKLPPTTTARTGRVYAQFQTGGKPSGEILLTVPVMTGK
jgi:hypothetical protein